MDSAIAKDGVRQKVVKYNRSFFSKSYFHCGSPEKVFSHIHHTPEPIKKLAAVNMKEELLGNDSRRGHHVAYQLLVTTTEPWSVLVSSRGER